MPDWFAKLPAALRLLCAAGAGGLGAFGQAPYDQPVAMVAALVLAFVFWRWQPSTSALTGWAFGTGYFGVALVWIVEPFQIDAVRHGWMAPFALIFLSAGLALFWGLAFWAARRLGVGAIGLVLTWTGAEILRAYIFTGFPWASPAQMTVNGAAAQILAWFGPHGATLALFLMAFVLASPVGSKAGAALRFGQVAVFLAGTSALYLQIPRPASEVSGHWVRLVQPNAAQALKWQADMAEVFLQRQLALTAAEPRDGDAPPDLIFWPETAIPWRLETAKPVLAEIMRLSGDVPVALGALRTQDTRLRNSLAVLGEGGTVEAVYDKHHLVPFGEYVPFAKLADRIGLGALAAAGGGFESGPGVALLDFDEIGKALPLICYEAVFAHGVNSAAERPDFLLQVTNDAWFGQFAGPQQHLAQARMRAIEQGLPLVRAANTGISAMIDPHGRLTDQLPLNTAGFLDAPLPDPLPATLYSKIGDLPILLTIILGFGVIGARGVSSRR